MAKDKAVEESYNNYITEVLNGAISVKPSDEEITPGRKVRKNDPQERRQIQTKKEIKDIKPQKKETKFNTPTINVKELRESMNMGQNLFANYIGVFQPQLSRWEKQCYLPLDIAWRIEDIFEINLKKFRIPDKLSQEIIRKRRPDYQGEDVAEIEGEGAELTEGEVVDAEFLPEESET
jgi:DNA-binding transcriptional regulator YiaG